MSSNRSVFVAIVLSIMLAPFAASPAFAEPQTLTIVTTTQGSSRVAGEGTELEPTNPGWQIELLRLAAEKAGVTFGFRRTTWKEALAMVEKGEADAAFNSSFRPERAVYGVYPKKEGELDFSRSTLNYAYWLYTPEGSAVAWNGSAFGNLAKPVAAELNASIVPDLKKAGAEVIEVKTYHEMLELLGEGKVEAIASFEGNLDVFLATAPQRYSDISRHPVPLSRKTGYLMFSKIFYAKNEDLAEGIWDAIADVWSSPTATEIRRRYE